MKTLYARIALAFMLIVTVLVGAVLLLSYFSMQQYHDEITQKLNQPIAMYVAGEYDQLQKTVGSDAAIRQLANHAMIINPTVEVYLLDAQGRIVADALPAGERQRSVVAIDRVKAFLAGNERYPLRGDDPRHQQLQKVFSAFAVTLADGEPGYVYVILGGKTFDTLVETIRSSYVAKTVLWGVSGLLLTGILLGLLVFSLLVRRLGLLTRAMQSFTRSSDGFTLVATPGLTFRERGDEIDQLSAAFTGMAGTIAQQMQKLQETDRLRRELISNVSHDLRTPLATTKGYIDTLLIKQGKLDGVAQSRYLQNAQRSLHRLGQLINDLFELSKLESGQVKAEFERFSILELIYDTVQEFSLEASQKNITINAPSPEHNTFVYGDLGLIQRVLENLLKNALKYTPENGRVSISYLLSNGKVTIAVEDTGLGIAEQDLPHIFDRFYRANHRGDMHVQSTGLGLAIVKRILELHSSRLTVSSQVDKGSCFRFDLDNGLGAH